MSAYWLVEPIEKDDFDAEMLGYCRAIANLTLVFTNNCAFSLQNRFFLGSRQVGTRIAFSPQLAGEFAWQSLLKQRFLTLVGVPLEDQTSQDTQSKVSAEAERGAEEQRIASGRGRLFFKWLPLAASVLFGLAGGLGIFAFNYAEGLSYLSTDPKACANCHIMNRQYDSWQKASHHGTATCAECHLPHKFIPKYIAKAENGWHHSVGFTFQNFPEPIRIKSGNAKSLQENCIRCHGGLTHPQRSVGRDGIDDVIPCVHCHASAGHGVQAGLGGPARRTKEHSRSFPSSEKK
jgi:cytochrome c nitrite reductase small subunit